MAGRSLQGSVRALVAEGVVKLRWHARLDGAPEALKPGLRLAEKVEGMLLGLAIGDALGNTSESMNPADRLRDFGWIDHYLPNEHASGRAIGLPSDDSQLAFWTIEHLLQHGELDPQRLGELFAQPERQIYGGGQATAAALSSIRRGMPWTHSGSPRASNGALMRIAAVLLPHLMRPSPALWTDTLAAAHLTHDDELSNGSCIAMVDMLWQLLVMTEAPEGSWWMNQWTETFDDIGCTARYAARNGHPPGFDGTICKLLRDHVQPALASSLDVAAAGEIWHSGALSAGDRADRGLHSGAVRTRPQGGHGTGGQWSARQRYGGCHRGRGHGRAVRRLGLADGVGRWPARKNAARRRWTSLPPHAGSRRTLWLRRHATVAPACCANEWPELKDGLVRAPDRLRRAGCRNYFVPVGHAEGQTRDWQINCLDDLGAALGHAIAPLWNYRNGYVLCSLPGLDRIRQQLAGADEAALDHLRGLLKVGLHWHVEVTDASQLPGPRVSQVFCSALPVAYSEHLPEQWEPFACLVLEAAYEATLLVGVCNGVQPHGSRRVLLTRLGGGAFGNDPRWIDEALHRAVSIVAAAGLQIERVSR